MVFSFFYQPKQFHALGFQGALSGFSWRSFERSITLRSMDQSSPSQTHTSGAPSEITGSRPVLDVLYECPEYVIIAKPAGMFVHRPQKSYDRTKEDNMTYVLQEANKQFGRKIYTPHRLDRGTSGCLVLAFSSDAATILHNAMVSDRCQKTYIALTRGEGTKFRDLGWFKVSRPIKDEKKILREATTYFNFVAGGADPRVGLVLAQPKTGRWHQIRKHLNGLAHPVLQDAVHGDTRFNKELRARFPGLLPGGGRLALHCWRLALPATPLGPAVAAVCPLPGELRAFLDRAGGGGGGGGGWWGPALEAALLEEHLPALDETLLQVSLQEQERCYQDENPSKVTKKNNNNKTDKVWEEVEVAAAKNITKEEQTNHPPPFFTRKMKEMSSASIIDKNSHNHKSYVTINSAGVVEINEVIGLKKQSPPP